MELSSGYYKRIVYHSSALQSLREMIMEQYRCKRFIIICENDDKKSAISTFANAMHCAMSSYRIIALNKKDMLQKSVILETSIMCENKYDVLLAVGDGECCSIARLIAEKLAIAALFFATSPNIFFALSNYSLLTSENCCEFALVKPFQKIYIDEQTISDSDVEAIKKCEQIISGVWVYALEKKLNDLIVAGECDGELVNHILQNNEYIAANDKEYALKLMDKLIELLFILNKENIDLCELFEIEKYFLQEIKGQAEFEGIIYQLSKTKIHLYKCFLDIKKITNFDINMKNAHLYGQNKGELLLMKINAQKKALKNLLIEHELSNDNTYVSQINNERFCCLLSQYNPNKHKSRLFDAIRLAGLI